MYELRYINKALKDLKNIDKSHQKFLTQNIREFVENFSSDSEKQLMQSGKIKKLQGVSEELYRLKLRSYRVIYKKEKDKLIILVLSLKSRENSYKK